MQNLMLNDETLTSLNLSGVMLGEHRTMGLLRILTEHNTSLTSLKLDGNSATSCGQEQMQQISRLLKCNTGLRHLSIFGSSVSDEDVGMLCEALKGNHSLLSLDLGANSISDQGAVALAHMLAVNTALTSLKLHGNQISDRGAAALSEACRTWNRHLVSLRLGYNAITSAGAAEFAALAEDIALNTTLQHLHLGGNPIFSSSGSATARGDDAWDAALGRWPLLFS